MHIGLGEGHVLMRAITVAAHKSNSSRTFPSPLRSLGGTESAKTCRSTVTFLGTSVFRRLVEGQLIGSLRFRDIRASGFRPQRKEREEGMFA